MGFRITYIPNFFAKKNKYIPLGCNCYTRKKLTRYGYKASKKQGELTYPFDLCVTPINTISLLLNNSFEDFFNNIGFSEEENCWVNTKYDIKFWHDNDIVSKEDLIKRYSRRIENFKKILHNSQNTNLRIITCKSDIKDKELLEINNIYKKLKEIIQHEKFKYIVINFVKETEENISSKTKLDEHIYYHEIKIHEDYLQTWWSADHDENEDNKRITELFFKYTTRDDC